MIEVADFTMKLGALEEPNLTTVAPVKFVPVILTTVPPCVGPLFGRTLLTVGVSVDAGW